MMSFSLLAGSRSYRIMGEKEEAFCLIQGVRLVYDLFQKPISSLIIDLGQKFLLMSANHGLPFYLRYGLKLLMSKYESVRGSPILYEQGHWLTAN